MMWTCENIGNHLCPPVPNLKPTQVAMLAMQRADVSKHCCTIELALPSEVSCGILGSFHMASR